MPNLSAWQPPSIRSSVQAAKRATPGFLTLTLEHLKSVAEDLIETFRRFMKNFSKGTCCDHRLELYRFEVNLLVDGNVTMAARGRNGKAVTTRESICLPIYTAIGPFEIVFYRLCG